jgi:hypothetical protein
MGNFSYISQNRNEAVTNPWHNETLCEIQYVKDGVVRETFRGIYDGYGCVKLDRQFKHMVWSGEVNCLVDVTENTRFSYEQKEFACSGSAWQYETTENSDGWGEMVDVHFGNGTDGFAIWHLRDMNELVPMATQRSKNDPNQGDLFDDEEDDEEY